MKNTIINRNIETIVRSTVTKQWNKGKTKLNRTVSRVNLSISYFFISFIHSHEGQLTFRLKHSILPDCYCRYVLLSEYCCYFAPSAKNETEN